MYIPVSPAGAVDLAIRIKAMGVKELTFDAFDTRKIDE